MSKKVLLVFLALYCVGLLFTACDNDSTSSKDDTVDTDNGDNLDDGGSTVGDLVVHEDPDDYIWESADVVSIQLNGDEITAESDSVSINGSIAAIVSSGTYSISGTLNNGRIIVDAEDEGTVRIIFNGVNISCSDFSPFYILSAEKTIIILADNTGNYLSDGAEYVFDDPDEDEPNAALFSKDDLTIYGTGSLTVDANYNDGITSKDGLIITSGTITIDAADDGIRGKDYLVIKNGNFAVQSGGDALKSDNDDGEGYGYIYIQDGVFSIVSGDDGLAAETDILVTGGAMTMTVGGGSFSTDASAKGIKAALNVTINDGTFSIDASDDAVHSNGDLIITGGTFSISTNDDGIHADSNLIIDDGNISILKSYEGIESAGGHIRINDGSFHIVSSDDALNVAGGGDGTPSNGTICYLYINGGYIVIEAVGDGIDVNGSIKMTGGTVLVHGPTIDNNGAIDYDVSFKITGGLLVAAGSAGMAQAPDASSTQYSLLLRFNSTIQAGKIVHIQSSDGQEILTFAPKKAYRSLVFSSNELTMGVTYKVYLNGSSDGTVTDGLYQDGTYTPGTLYTSFTVSQMITSVY